MTNNNENFSPHVKREITDPVVKEIADQIRDVYDPEIPVNIYDLGLIYEINVNMDKAHVDIVMTLTSPFCPAAEELPMWTHEAVCSVSGIHTCNVEVTFTPPWTPEMIPEHTKFALGIE